MLTTLFLIVISIFVLCIFAYFCILLPLGLVLGLSQDAIAYRKYRKFYDECLERGIAKPDISEKEKIELIAQKHNVPDGYATFEKIYKAKTRPKMPAEQKRKYFVSLGIGAAAGLILGFIVSMNLSGQINWVLVTFLPVCGAVIGICVYHLSKPFTEMNQQKQEKINRINNRLNKM